MMRGHLRLVRRGADSVARRTDEKLEMLEQMRWHIGQAALLARKVHVPIALFVTIAREMFVETKHTKI